MLYYLIRPFARLTFQLLYRNIKFQGIEHIPKGVPVVFAVNHPTAFIEPCIMATWLPKSLSFIVRGDLFKKLWARILLASVHLIPMFRVKDGGLNIVKNNYESLRYVVHFLHKKGWLMILAEGHITTPRRLGPLKKGTARIALNTLEQRPNCGLVIMPVGVNMSHPDAIGSDIHVKIGQAIQAADYFDMYEAHANKGIMALTERLRLAMKDLLIQIENPEDDSAFDALLNIHSALNPVTVNESFDKRVVVQKDLLTKVGLLDQNAKTNLFEQQKALEQLFKANHLSYYPFDLDSKVKYWLIILTYLLAPFGLLVAIPFYFAKWVNSKIKIVDVFLVSVLFASVMGAGVLFFGGLTVGFGMVSLYYAALVLLIMNLGLLFVRIKYLYHDELLKIRFNQLNLDQRSLIVDSIQAFRQKLKSLQ